MEKENSPKAISGFRPFIIIFAVLTAIIVLFKLLMGAIM